ncbi:uncharacterized protein LOC108145288 [Drosophila elegans]|uniref:uncharacterized protein LOC108145288 n=1 Tax=Drosophila elegans TaxID=30023 RepID=UPI001BC84889|nr:uncharacterized protein LOC108145288 [Drosophila elegans]XP_041564606.1 uncharacterized protein LOC108145288 [Drosophila elegans]XP_041564607.1 uncharacterized protein LOC108145288 [Drosophila elegans]XP_041564608.1 uncharacterized protein LOC108145288 [Drosophila elegans]
MLQPRESNSKSDRCLKNDGALYFCSGMIYFSFFNKNMSLALLITLILTIFPIEASQTIDQPNLVSPTPTLAAIPADDITTVLLVNNESGHVGDSHGRFLTVRPEIGVLTSTARTFIQDGITTEFATKIVGTTLNNGRLYAQYLRKSSRILYKNEHLAPSVVTSWVGEEDSQQTPLYLQSHNDLFNSDDTDWQNIDDSLGVHRGEFVGNTDFVSYQSTILKDLRVPAYKDDKPRTSLETQSSTRNILKYDSNTKDEINKMFNESVSSIENLETFTVKSNIGSAASDLYSPREERKHGRLIQPRAEKNIESQEYRTAHQQALATVTYYGFAEFTTIVGDSVIVFSPSTTQSSLHLGHVTSIKGSPTLQPESIHDLIHPNVENSQNTLSTIKTTEKVEVFGTSLSLGLDISDSVNDKESHSDNLLNPNSIISSNTRFSNLLSVEADTSTVSPQEAVLLISTRVEDSKSTSSDTNDGLELLTNQIEPSIRKQEGATTIFIDDDPFTSFVELKEPTSFKFNSADQEKPFQNIEISKSDDKDLVLTYQTIENAINNKNDSAGSMSVIETSNITVNSINELCNHTTSQVFLTQMPKSLEKKKEDGIVDEANLLLAYDIVETTKYYCIQASQSEQKPELNSVIASYETVTEAQGELMSTEFIDDVDETTTRDSEDYDVTTENEFDGEDDDYDSVTNDLDLIYKTLYTTYTYLTTFFEGSRSTISSHTEILTNIISSTIGAGAELQLNTLINFEENKNIESTIREGDNKSIALVSKYTIPVEIVSLLTQENKINDDENKSISAKQITTTDTDDFKYSKTLYTTYTYYTSIFTNNETEVQSRTEVVTNYVTDKMPNSQINTSIESDSQSINQHFSASEFLLAEHEIEREEHNFEKEVNSSRLSNANRETYITKNSFEDQVSSESNTEEIIPSATFLLQTSFTTFTFYTTMYVGDDTNIISRLETVTNVATETLQPTKILNLEESSLPITYFTTFTYWTKLAKDGEITTLSREETLSNVIQPTNVTLITVDDLSRTKDTNLMQSIPSDIQTQNQSKAESGKELISTVTDPSFRSDITTYFTTYTYYTTSYNVNMTIIDSRFETLTNVVTSGEVSLSTADTSAVDLMIKPSQPVTGIEYKSIPSTPNVVLYDYKQIIDAEEVSTLYFTTEIVSSLNSDGHDVEITSSTSRLHIDESKKSVLATVLDNISDASLSSLKLYKTGLLRLIEGKRIQNSTTTLYQSKVIGTVIDNRYAQIIESTSSFFFEKSKSEDVLLPTTVKSNNMATETLHSTEISTPLKNKNDDETISLKDQNNSNEDLDGNIDELTTPHNTKRPFAPVIRPFASRNRPTFAPKPKTVVPSSATIITRSDITPTITATPALKSAGRYTSSRRGVISNVPINPNESSLSYGQSSRRLFGRPTKSLTSSIDSNATQKNRFVSSSRAVVASRRPNINISYRSSSVPGFRASGIQPISRLRIKPTNSGLVPSDRLAQSTSLAKELSSESSGEEENSTDEVNEEDENTRRTNNPLLRFRRPINGPIGFTSGLRQSTGSSSAVSLRRNPLTPRSKTSTTTSSTTTTTAKPRPRSFQRPVGLQPRSRPQNALFPPRGLFQNVQKEESLKEVKSNDSENDSEHEDDDANNAEDDDLQENFFRSKRSIHFLARPKIGMRVRRQADTVNRNRFRFRRQNQTAPLTKQESNLPGSDDRTETTSIPRDKSSSRFGSRFHSPQGQQLYTQTTLVDSTTATNHRSIRPTRPTAKRSQFTLREKDATLKSTSRSSSTNNFRRQPTSGNASIRRPVASNAGNLSSRRLKSYVGYNNQNNGDHGRLPSTPRSRSSNSNALNRGRGRGRSRNEYSADLQSIEHEVQTITVTHFIPSEVTVPVVSGHVTEYKNIVTAKTSTELVGPKEYTQVLGTNGLSSTYLNREVSSINIAGATEHTKYLLHESITSSVIFTPTTIRGRKTSFSHIIPSTAYSVEYLVTTIQPQISDNAPLANILLSQLLLGNLNLPAHPIIGAVGQQPSAASALIPTSVEPVTEYRTHTSTYVTTIFDGKSTILPVTFQGKKILTTVYDTTAQTITATEYSVDTIVNTVPFAQNVHSVAPAAQVNNLLLQQLLQQQQESLSLVQAISNTLPPQIFLSENLQDLDDVPRSSIKPDGIDSDFAPISNESQLTKSQRKKSRKAGSGHKRSKQSHTVAEKPDPNVVTLYVSGRRPGEFSTVLSTVGSEYDHSVSLQKRQVILKIQPTVASIGNKEYFYYTEESEDLGKEEDHLSKDQIAFSTVEVGFNELSDRTASLESIVGDVHLWYANSSRQSELLSTTINSIVV